MSGDGFTRTLQTATDAASMAALLRRAAKEVRAYQDRLKLEILAERYSDYSKSLIASVLPEQTEAPDDEQAELGLVLP